jgi:mRNA interferase HigB
MRTWWWVRVISHKAIVRFGQRHPEAATSLDAWYRITRRADWSGFADVRTVFPSVDRVGASYVFDIPHNRYRLVAEVNFTHRCVFVRRILTHAEYDRRRWQS